MVGSVCKRTDQHASQLSAEPWVTTKPVTKSSTKGEALTVSNDQFKGQAKDIAGKLVGSTAQPGTGIKLQVEGKAQKSLGDAKELVKDTRQATFDLIVFRSLAGQCPG